MQLDFSFLQEGITRCILRSHTIQKPSFTRDYNYCGIHVYMLLPISTLFCFSLNFESFPGRNHFGAEIVLMCGAPHLPHLFTGMSLARPIGLKAGLGTKIEPAGPFITTHWNELQF